MSKQLELTVKIRGTDDELKKISAALRGIGTDADKSGKSLDTVNSSLVNAEKHVNSLAKGVEGAGHSFEGFHERVRANLENPIQSAQLVFTGYLDKLGKAPAIIAGVSVGMGVLAIKSFEFVAAQAEAAKGTVNFADRLGVSVGQALKFQAAAKLAGVDVGVLESATRLLSAALEDQSGQGAKSAKALKALGVQLYDSKGDARDMGEVLVDLLSALSKVEDGSKRTFLAQQILGRGSKELLPLIKNLDELNAAVERLGVGLDADVTKNLANAADEIDKLEIGWDRFKKSLAAKIAPVIIPIVQVLTGNPLGLTEAQQKFLESTTTFAGAQEEQQKKQAAAFKSGFDPKAASGALGLDTSGVQTGPAQAKKIADDFKKVYDSSDEYLKKHIQELKKESDEVAAAINSGGITELTAVKKKKEDYDKINQELTAAEAEVKRRTELPAALKKLAELQAKVGDVNEKDRRPAAVISQELQELRDTLGPKYDAALKAIAQTINSQRNAAVGDIITQNQIKLRDELKKNGGEISKNFEDYNKAFEKDVKETAQKDRDLAKFYQDSLKSNMELGGKGIDIVASARIKGINNQALPGQEAQVADQTARIQIQAAKDKLALEAQYYQMVIDNGKAADATEETQKEGLQAQIALVKAEGDAREAIDKAELEREDALIEKRKKGLEDYRNEAGNLFDAITSRSSKALRDFALGGLKEQAKNVFENLTTGTIAHMGGVLGQVGKDSGLGGILHGTILDPSNAETPLTKNTESITALQASVDQLTATLGGPAAPGTVPSLASLTTLPGGTSGRGGIATIPGLSTLGSDITGITGGSTGSVLKMLGSSAQNGVGNFVGGLGSVITAGLFAGVTGLGKTAPGEIGPTLMSPTARIGNIAGSAAAVAAGTFGVINGINQGGARGIGNAISSGLGVAALIPGPQQPFIAAAAAITGLISGLLGDPKVARAHQISAELDKAQAGNVLPTSYSVFTDSSGKQISYDYTGKARSLANAPLLQEYNKITGVTGNYEYGYGHLDSSLATQLSLTGQPVPAPTTTINMTVQTMDSKSFNDNAPQLATAVQTAIANGHPIRKGIQRFIKPN